MLTELTALATETSSEKRRVLLGRIADLFYNDGRDQAAEYEMQLFASVVTRLLKDVDAEGRRTFSSIVAGNERTPHDVAMALANDEAAIAAPVLQRSPQLTDDDLIAIATTRTVDHRVAISKRPNITARVTDSLIDFGELEVMQTLLENQTATLSTQSFEMIAGQSATSADLRQNICLRGDLPVSAARKLMPYLEEPDRTKIQALIDRNGGHIDELVRRALPEMSSERSERAKNRIEAKALAAEVEARRLSIDAMVDQLTVAKRTFDVALALSELSMLPEKQVVNAMLSMQTGPLALICKALGVGTDSYVFVDRLRCEAMKIPNVADAQLRTEYGRLDQVNAQRTLRLVNVRATLKVAS